MTLAKHQGRAFEGTLRVVLAVMLVGVGRTTHLHGSPVASVLWHDLGWSEAAFVGLDRVAGIVCYATACLVLVIPRGRARWLLLPALLWLVLIPVAKLRAGGDFGYLLAPFTKGNRPLALLALFYWLGATQLADRAVRLLVIGVAAVFASHGLEAILQNPRFVDYILVSFARATPWTVSEGLARAALIPIGVVDIAVAVLVLRGPSRRALAWAAFWGLLTAAMRLIYFGPVGGAHHAAIRALNGGGAVILLLALRAGLSYPRLRLRSPALAPGTETARA